MPTFTVSDLSTAINTHRDYDIVVSLLDVGVDVEECFGEIDQNRHLVLLFDDTSGDSPNGPMPKHVDIVSTFIGLRIKPESKILIHCHMGVSRSTAMTIGMRMMFLNETAEHAVHRTYFSRPEMNPNQRIIRILDTKLGQKGKLKIATSRWRGENLIFGPYGSG